MTGARLFFGGPVALLRCQLDKAAQEMEALRARTGQDTATEARIRPEDVNRVQPRQAAEIRFTAFQYRTTLLVQSTVVHISADRLVDRATNAPYYSVLVEANPVSLKAAGELKLQAGMPAEIYINGEQRTPLQYLVEPVTQVLRRAARER